MKSLSNPSVPGLLPRGSILPGLMLTSLVLIGALLMPNTAAANCSPALDFELRRLASDETVRLCDAYQGKVILAVNTASKCGFTPQYAGLQRLHERFGDRGFAVLGFPSGDFMNQEFGTADEIAEFCSTTYQVTFPLFAKVRTKPGEGQSPVYEFLGTRTGELPAWNFGKYLVDREGRPIAYWGSRTAPESEDIVAAIETALAGETSAEDAAAAAG